MTRLIGEQVHQAVIKGASKAVGEFDTQLLASARAAQWATQVMEEQHKGLSAVQHALIWKGLLALFIGALLAIGGAGFVAWDSMRAIRTAHFEQDVLQAVQSGAITKCGDALCAKVGKQSRRYGSNGDYVLLSQ